MTKKFITAGILLLGLVFSAGTSASSFSNLFVFGDSLSDIGNVYALTVPTGYPVPNPTTNNLNGQSYYNGRFTNGYNYIDGVAANLGLSLSPSRLGGNDYAYGGARTDSHPSGLPLSVENQVAGFLSGLGSSSADANALYVLWAGANNIQDAVGLAVQTSALGNPTAEAAIRTAAVTNAVGDIENMLKLLAGADAREFLVPNVPNMGLVPRIAAAGTTAAAFAASVTDSFNQLLDAMLNTLSGLDIKYFDSYSLVQQVVANPAAFGFTNVIGRCFTGDDINWTGGGSVCADPDSYLFWDSIHPSAHAQAIIAQSAYQVLVPAPSSVALLFLGLGVLVANRRNVKQSKIRLA